MPEKNDLNNKTMGELADTAHREGIPFVAHMSQSELVEAIEQQREANELQPEVQPPLPRQPSDEQATGKPTPAS